MLGDVLGYVFFGVLVYMMFKVFIKGVIPGVFDGLKVLCKVIFWLTLGPVFLVVKVMTGNFNRGYNSNPVGVARETITVVDRFKDKKGREVTINKRIDLGTRTVTKKDLNKLR